MPAPETTDASKKDAKPEQVQQQPARELTQTDHLNKKLLTSLFNRLDEGGEESLSKMMEPDSTDQTQDQEWSD